MGRAKEIELKVIPSKIANPFIKQHHYSGGVVSNSSLHFGAFLDGKLHGVLSYGPSMDKSKIIGLVSGTKWNEFLELNRMAFDEYLPRNSESYCIAKSIQMIKKNAPQIKWIVSFADGCSCGDGTIYRASNFILTGIKPNSNIIEMPNGFKFHKFMVEVTPEVRRKEFGGRNAFEICGGPPSIRRFCERTGAKPLPGFQLRYIYFIDASYRNRLTVPEIPFSRIDEVGAGMYKGQKITRAERHEKT